MYQLDGDKVDFPEEGRPYFQIWWHIRNWSLESVLQHKLYTFDQWLWFQNGWRSKAYWLHLLLWDFCMLKGWNTVNNPWRNVSACELFYWALFFWGPISGFASCFSVKLCWSWKNTTPKLDGIGNVGWMDKFDFRPSLMMDSWFFQAILDFEENY